MRSARPRVVLLTGAPGSGKSTLGRELATQLRIPFLARDDIRGGLLFSEGAWTDELRRVPSSDEAVEAFLATVEGLLVRGVSCVVEYVVRRHRPGDLQRITALGDCVVIMTECDDPTSRVVERNSIDRLIANRSVLDAIGVSSVDEHTATLVGRMRQVQTEMLLEFRVPVLEVDTTAGYRPSMDEIVTFATAASAGDH